MRIYTKLVMHWEGSRYVIGESKWIEYHGPIALCCGATSAQTGVLNQQQQNMQETSQQAQQVFGNSSTVFNDLMGTFAPTVAAGPDQQGFSAAENSNLQSQAITQTGQAYKNAKAATGDAISAEGGGNVDLPTGATIGVDANLASGAANQTASELGQINEQNYATGRQNYDTAVTGLENAPKRIQYGHKRGQRRNELYQRSREYSESNRNPNQSWVQAVTGVIGTVAGDATKAAMM